MRVDLPAPEGPTRKMKSPDGMTRSTSMRADLPLGYVFVTAERRTELGTSGSDPGAWSG